MGGFGSGRQDGMPCTDEMRSLDVRGVQRAGRLMAGTCCTWEWTRNGNVTASIQMTVQTDRVWLEYRQRQRDGGWRDVGYSVLLDRTACHMGGERPWWRCPRADCGRRCAILYGGLMFACRQCQQLAYRSQRETAGDRATRQANKLRKRMGWTPGILNFHEGKPKGMQWRTFYSLQLKYFAHSEKALGGFGVQLERLQKKLKVGTH